MSKYVDTDIQKFKLKYTEEEDVPVILALIKELAQYENLQNEVTATEEVLAESLYRRKAAEVILGVYDGMPVGYMLFFTSFSTFLGKPGIYLEDLYIKPEYRKKGFGKTMLAQLAKMTVERGCGRLEWACLDWNEPSIKFYRGLGAVPMDGWTTYRLAGDTLNRFT